MTTTTATTAPPADPVLFVLDASIMLGRAGVELADLPDTAPRLRMRRAIATAFDVLEPATRDLIAEHGADMQADVARRDAELRERIARRLLP